MAETVRTRPIDKAIKELRKVVPEAEVNHEMASRFGAAASTLIVDFGILGDYKSLESVVDELQRIAARRTSKNDYFDGILEGLCEVAVRTQWRAFQMALPTLLDVNQVNVLLALSDHENRNIPITFSELEQLIGDKDMFNKINRDLSRLGLIVVYYRWGPRLTPSGKQTVEGILKLKDAKREQSG